MFCATVLDESRLKCWKIMPIFWRNDRKAAPLMAVTSAPSTSTLPPSGRSSALTRRISVDFPAPERPTMPNTSPVFTFRSTSRSAGTSCPPTR